MQRVPRLPGSRYVGDMLLVASAFAAEPSWSTDLADLDPDLRAKVESVMLRLVDRGFDPRASCTFRSNGAQDVLFGLGSTNARGGRSCHNHTKDGDAASWAVDLWDGGLGLGLIAGWDAALDAQVPFLLAIGEEGRAAGLGWDPAHLQDRRCR